MASLTRTANKWFKRKDGSTLVIRIEPNFDHELESAGNIFEYLLYTENFGMFNVIFTPPPPELPNPEPVYLGRILFDNDQNWIYDGESLTVFEQEEIAEFIRNFEHSESDNL